MKNIPIIFFSNTDVWEKGLVRNIQQLVKHLSLWHPIIFIQKTQEPLPLLFSDFQQIKNWISLIWNIFKFSRKRQRVYSLPLVSSKPTPLFTYSKFDKFIFLLTFLIYSNIVEIFYKKRDLKYILILTSPEHINFINLKNCILKCYYCYDNYSEYPTFSKRKKIIQQMEEDLVKNVDIVLVSSHFLLRKKKYLNPSTYLIPNATDFMHYQKSIALPSFLEKKIFKFSKPIIGYSGKLDSSKIDVELLLYLFHEKPHYTFLFVGEIENVILNKIKKFKNVYFINYCPYEFLPAIIRKFDVCILPHQINQLTIAMSPLKLYDYFAVGKRGVSTPLPEVEQYKEVLFIAKSHREFIEQIEIALRTKDDPILIQKRLFIAQQNDWEKRWEKIEKIFSKYL